MKLILGALDKEDRKHYKESFGWQNMGRSDCDVIFLDARTLEELLRRLERVLREGLNKGEV